MPKLQSDGRPHRGNDGGDGTKAAAQMFMQISGTPKNYEQMMCSTRHRAHNLRSDDMVVSVSRIEQLLYVPNFRHTLELSPVEALKKRRRPGMLEGSQTGSGGVSIPSSRRDVGTSTFPGTAGTPRGQAFLMEGRRYTGPLLKKNGTMWFLVVGSAATLEVLLAQGTTARATGRSSSEQSLWPSLP